MAWSWPADTDAVLASGERREPEILRVWPDLLVGMR